MQEHTKQGVMNSLNLRFVCILLFNGDKTSSTAPLPITKCSHVIIMPSSVFKVVHETVKLAKLKKT